MPYPHVLQRPSILVHKDIIELLERVEPLDDVPEHRMLPVEVFHVVRKCDEELAPAAALVLLADRRRNRHRDCAPRAVLEARYEFGREIARGLAIAVAAAVLRAYQRPDGLSAGACSCRVTDLSQKVLRDWS